ncbi:MAG TPA: ABC transporter permease [Clostridiales bacterium]|nr:ABC transporter permease [Clostridiales bacterium]
MFLHIYMYRLKCILRDKQNVFWTLMFPIILATLFYLAFSNLSNAESFTEIEVGIVDNEELREHPEFTEAVKSVPDLFNVTYTTKENAEKLLEDGEIEGYIHFDDGLKLFVKESGINETIIKSFLDDFLQTSSTISTIISQNPAAVQNGLPDSVFDRTDYLKAVPSGKAEPNTVVNYFYSLIAMACLYGSFSGLKEVLAMQGNLSYQGARVNMAPIHKAKIIIASMSAAVSFQLIAVTALLVYLIAVLRVDFGNQVGYIALTSIVSTITGVTFGTFISSVNRQSEGVKIGILIGSSMIMTFLSGMMYDKMKYIVHTKVPVLSYLNPANLITDSFYALYYFDTHARFFTNIALLCGYSVLFGTLTYLAVRRQRYASI